MSKDERGQHVDLVRDYAENPIIRALVRLIPHGIGSAADVLIMDHIDQMKKHRVRTFFDELASGHVVLSEELIRNNDFLHSLDATMRAAFRARREEKIRMFARLLRNGIIMEGVLSPDDYEELVGLLDELSYREWRALLLFEQHLSASAYDPNGLARINSIWPGFTANLQNQLGVVQAESSSFMNRIGRTGLYGEITGSYLDYGGGLGNITPKFYRFRKLVEGASTDAP